MSIGIRNSGVVTVLLVLAAVFCAGAQEQGMELGDFRVPQYDEQGRMTYQLFGERAFLESDGRVNVEGVRVEFYREGNVFMEVSSPYCFYDRDKREVWSDAAVSTEMDDAVLTGTGYRLNVEARTVHVLNKSRLVFAAGMPASEPDSDRSDPSGETVITSKELFLDYNQRSARFNESVRVENEETVLECEKLDVFFDENNTLEKAVAESSVRISNQDMTMSCGALNVSFSGENEIDEAVADSSVVISNAEWTVSGARGRLMVSDRKALLEEDVRVESKEMTLTCAKLNLAFDESNEINWIEALGDVRILNEGKKASSGKAVYTAETDEFLLEENPKLIDGKNMLMGDRIRFWRSTGRMVCEPARAVIFPDEDFKTQLFEK
ncbi:MAG TPA: LptA/OstA family protein [Tichowtungia sp.]|nr:LptA/OstA family protein [Tichowtungia sp.]